MRKPMAAHAAPSSYNVTFPPMAHIQEFNALHVKVSPVLPVSHENITSQAKPASKLRVEKLS